MVYTKYSTATDPGIATEYNSIMTRSQPTNDELAKINTKNMTIDQKQVILSQLGLDIENRENLLLTRSRMLQISTDRNSYKQKLIYTLIGIAIAIFIIFIFLYVFLKNNKGLGMRKKVVYY